VNCVKIFNDNHPFIRRSLKVLNSHFKKTFLEDQKILERDIDKVLSILQPNLKENSLVGLDSDGIWKVLQEKCKESALNHLKFQYLYMRLDSEVSIHLNHLLKSPFCIHPGTGKVCVPISMDEIDSFNPFQVPTAQQLFDELEAYEALSQDETSSVQDFQKTSLKKYVETFQNFLAAIDKSRSERISERNEDLEKNLTF
jgi:DNA primase small subunit